MFRTERSKGGGEPAQVWFSQLPDRQSGGDTIESRYNPRRNILCGLHRGDLLAPVV
jgi:hypothetical protein